MSNREQQDRTRTDRIHLVMVPTTDQDRSVAFYTSLGFAVRVDVPFGDGQRWIELFPAGGLAGIALVPATTDMVGTITGLLLPVVDIAATHARLRAAGADVDAGIAGKGSPVAITLGAVELVEPFPTMFGVRDPDGNAFVVIGDGPAPLSA